MSRKDVFDAIEEERAYQEKWDAARDDTSQLDADKPVEAWLLWMEHYMQLAREAASTKLDKTAALHHVRKITALGVACMEYNGAPRRE
jgi:hypothetical protein